MPRAPDIRSSSEGVDPAQRTPSLHTTDRPVTRAGLAHLLVVYVVWGSTYLAIRVAVREGSGFPPFFMGASRTLAAASILLIWNLLRRQRILPTRREWLTLAPSGLLLWLGGNGLVNWAERRADSGYAALLIGATPIWVVLMESIVDRRRPTIHLIGALGVAFAGLAVLTYPVLRTATGAGLAEAVALVVAPLSWGSGSVYQMRRPVGLGPTASAAWQQTVGGAGFLAGALLLGEGLPHPTAEASAAYLYLVVAGSIIAFTSYVTALRLLPATLVATYAYVNPVIAVFLGWLILGEPITIWTVAGATLILAGVAGAFHEKRVRARRNRDQNRPMPRR